MKEIVFFSRVCDVHVEDVTKVIRIDTVGIQSGKLSEKRSAGRCDQSSTVVVPAGVKKFGRDKVLTARGARCLASASHFTSPTNIGIPNLLRAVSPLNIKPFRSGASPRSPTCCVNVCATKLDPRKTVCLPYRPRNVSMV